jgi:hypothetical protein
MKEKFIVRELFAGRWTRNVDLISSSSDLFAALHRQLPAKQKHLTQWRWKIFSQTRHDKNELAEAASCRGERRPRRKIVFRR